MLRRLFNLVATLSLILGFTAVVFWIRSYPGEEAICYGHPDESVYYQLTSDRGLVAFERIDLSGQPNEVLVEYLRGLWAYSLTGHPVQAGWARYYGAGTVRVRWIFIQADGMRAVGYPRPGAKQFVGPQASAIAVPYWTVTGLLLLLPIARMASLAQQRRRRLEGPCPRCGQPLDDDGRCPRCEATAVDGDAGTEG